MLRHADDERLAALAAAGSSDAFDVLVQRHEARLLMVSRRVLRSDDDARDAVQNALLKAFRALQAGQLRGAPRPWLSRIAHREACSLARVRREFAPLDADALGLVGGDPHEAVLLKERLATLVADVAALPERLRAPLLLRAETGLSYDEIGRSLGVSGTAARQAVFAARDALTEEAAARDADCASIRSILAESDLRRLRSRRVRGHLKACAACRAFRPAPRARFSLFGAGGLAWNLVSWVNGLFTTSATTAGTAFRSTAVVAAVAGGSLSLGAADRHADLGRVAQPEPKTARDKEPEVEAADMGGGATSPLPDASWSATSSSHGASTPRGATSGGDSTSAGQGAPTRRAGTSGGAASPSRGGTSDARGSGSSSYAAAHRGGAASYGAGRGGSSVSYGGGTGSPGAGRGGGSASHGGGTGSPGAGRGGGSASHGGGAMSYGAGRGGGSSPHGGPRSGGESSGAGRGGGTASNGAGPGGVASDSAAPGGASTSYAADGGATTNTAASGGASSSDGAAPGGASTSDGASSGVDASSSGATAGGGSSPPGTAPGGANAPGSGGASPSRDAATGTPSPTATGGVAPAGHGDASPEPFAAAR